MDNLTAFDHLGSLEELLAHGEVMTRRLEIRLQELTLSEPFINLAQEIRLIFSKAISITKLANGGENHQACKAAVNIAADSWPSITESLCSDTSDLAFKDNDRKKMCKKRRTTEPKWTNQVRLVAGPGAEGPMDDGYSWRKYGQKDILGAKHPRAYYRCSYQNTQGCPAMKQVQRCEANPSVFDVTYRGKHNCSQKNKTSPSLPLPEPLSNTASMQLNQPNDCLPMNQSQQLLFQYQHDQELLQTFKTSLKMKTEGLDSDISTASFSFQSTPFSCPAAPEHGIIAALPSLENHFIDSFSSPTSVFPATSESIFFSQCELSNFGGGPTTLLSPEREVISALTSRTNSPIVNRDLEFGHFDNSDVSRFFS